MLQPGLLDNPHDEGDKVDYHAVNDGDQNDFHSEQDSGGNQVEKTADTVTAKPRHLLQGGEELIKREKGRH